jgi:hypothetical protein
VRGDIQGSRSTRLDDFDLFLSIAEIAGIFVGFGALISLLGDRQAMGRVALNIVISIGLVVLVAALIPVALSHYGLTDRALWSWSSGAFLVICWTAILAPLRDSKTRTAIKDDTKTSPVVAAVFWVLLEIPIQVPLVLAVFGVAPPLARAFYVTSLVLNLFQAAFLLGRLVFARDLVSKP